MTIIIAKRVFQQPNRHIVYTLYIYICVNIHVYVAEQRKAFHKAHTIQNSRFR